MSEHKIQCDSHAFDCKNLFSGNDFRTDPFAEILGDDIQNVINLVDKVSMVCLGLEQMNKTEEKINFLTNKCISFDERWHFVTLSQTMILRYCVDFTSLPSAILKFVRPTTRQNENTLLTDAWVFSTFGFDYMYTTIAIITFSFGWLELRPFSKLAQ